LVHDDDNDDPAAAAAADGDNDAEKKITQFNLNGIPVNSPNSPYV
jgi:hypothetical protein